MYYLAFALSHGVPQRQLGVASKTRRCPARRQHRPGSAWLRRGLDAAHPWPEPPPSRALAGHPSTSSSGRSPTICSGRHAVGHEIHNVRNRDSQPTDGRSPPHQPWDVGDSVEGASLDGDSLSLDREDLMTGGRARNRQRPNRRRKAVRTPGRHIQALRNRSGCSAGVRSRLARCRTRPHAPRATNRCGRRRSGHTVRPSRGERQGTAGKIPRRSPRNEPTHSSLPTSTATVPAPNAGVSAWRTISRTRSVFGSTFTTMDAPPP